MASAIIRTPPVHPRNLCEALAVGSSNYAGPQRFCHPSGALRVGTWPPCWERWSGDVTFSSGSALAFRLSVATFLPL